MFVKIGKHIINMRNIAATERRKGNALRITLAAPDFYDVGGDDWATGAYHIELTGPEADKLERYLAAGAIDLDLETEGETTEKATEKPAESTPRIAKGKSSPERQFALTPEVGLLIGRAVSVVGEFRRTRSLDMSLDSDRELIDGLADAADAVDRLCSGE